MNTVTPREIEPDAIICVVLFDRRPQDSQTLQSLASLLDEANVSLFVHNNGPTRLDEHDQAWLRNHFPKISLAVRENLANISLAEVYNEVLEHPARAYAFFDHDSTVSPEYLQGLLTTQPYELVIPRIRTPGASRNPKWRGKVLTQDCSLESFQGGLRTITSGLALNAALVTGLRRTFGKVFDERYRLYGVDTSFFLRLDRFAKQNTVVVRVSGVIDHSLSRLEQVSDTSRRFRATERGYDLGITLRNYPHIPTWASLVREIAKTVLLRGGVSWRAFVTGYVRGAHPSQSPPKESSRHASSDLKRTQVTFIEPKSEVYGGQHALLQRCIYLKTHTDIAFEILHASSQSAFHKAAIAAGLASHVRVIRAPGNSAYAIRLLAIAWHLFRHRPAIIHLDGFDSCYVVCALKAVRALRSRIIFTVRSDRYHRFTVIDRFLLSYVDELITNSEYSRDQILRAAGMTARVHYSPIDLERILSEVREMDVRARQGSHVVVSYVGSIEPRKRLDFFIRVAALIASRDDRYVFHVYGEAKNEEGATYLSALEDAIGANLRNRVFFKGYKPIATAISSTDILLCPFVNEPLGRVVPEFLYCGREVVVSNSGGLAEAGRGFAHVYSQDSESECAEMVLAAGTTRRQDISVLRKTLIERFSPASCGGLDCQLYKVETIGK